MTTDAVKTALKPDTLAGLSRSAKECRAKFTEAIQKQPGLISFGCVTKRLQLKNSGEAEAFFGGFRAASAQAFTFGNGNGLVYTELVSDNVWLNAGIGMARLGVSAQLSTSADTTKGTLEQLFQGGGNTVIHLTLPLTMYTNFIRDNTTLNGALTVTNEPIRTIESFFTLAIGGDMPELNKGVGGRAGFARLGVQSHLAQRTMASKVQLSVTGSVDYAIGFSPAFYTNLSAKPVRRPDAGMAIARLTTGIDLASKLRIGVSWGWSTIREIRQPARLSLQLL
jgi:hypothetical protein